MSIDTDFKVYINCFQNWSKPIIIEVIMNEFVPLRDRRRKMAAMVD